MTFVFLRFVRFAGFGRFEGFGRVTLRHAGAGFGKWPEFSHGHCHWQCRMRHIAQIPSQRMQIEL